MSVFVIKTPRLAEVLAFFQALGLEFVEEKHGDGPTHYSHERDGLVFEIYPSSSDKSSAKFVE